MNSENNIQWDHHGRLSRRSGRRLCHRLLTVLIITVSATVIYSCGGQKQQKRYAAEKELFKARKMKNQLPAIATASGFYNKTISAYRDIVRDYQDDMYRIEGMEYIVLSAQMELAELQFSSGLLEEARNSFDRAYDMSRNFPEARANALFSCAVISGEMEDHSGAIKYFTRLYSEFLDQSRALQTADMNSRYLLAPLRVAEIYKKAEKQDQASRWFEKAGKLFTRVEKSTEDSTLAKEMKFNLLTIYLKSKDWNRALSQVNHMKETYRNSERDMASLLYTEAQIYRSGLNRSKEARELFTRIYQNYPGTTEALNAILNNADFEAGSGNFNQARTLYHKAIDQYADHASRAAEALWHLAAMAQEEGDWVEASLRYKELYQAYPGTVQGMESLLQLARHYREKGEDDTVDRWYSKAIQHYRELLSSQNPKAVNILAEEYIITALSEQEKWNRAVERLLDLPERYPYYENFRGNCLMAASICEKELNDRNRAVEILRRCSKKYPGSEVAREAEEQIRRLEDER